MNDLWQMIKGAQEALMEAKDSRINSLPLTKEQKEKIIKIFYKFPQLEAKIDWNRKDLRWEDFTDVIQYSEFKDFTEFNEEVFLALPGTRLIWKDKNKAIYEFNSSEAAEYISRRKRGNYEDHGMTHSWCIAKPKILNNFKADGSRFYYLRADNLGSYSRAVIYNNNTEPAYEDGPLPTYDIESAYNKNFRQWLSSIEELNNLLKKMKINFEFTEEMFI